jgi:DnaK suppressor protein
MFTRRTTSRSRKTQRRTTASKKERSDTRDTVPGKKSYSRDELEYFRMLLIIKRDEAFAVLRDCEELISSIQSNESSDRPREWPLYFSEWSADSVAREEYAVITGRQKKLIGYLDAAIKRIDAGSYGICTSCHERIPRERLEAVPHTKLCLSC